MPNWVSNNVRISGTNKQIASVLSECFDENGKFSFQKVRPMPEELNIRSPQFTDEEKKQAEINIQKYGSPDWYMWCINNWGTKWDCRVQYQDLPEIPINDNPDDMCEIPITLCFDTAWDLPDSLIVELVRKYGVSAEGEWLDEDLFCGNCGTYTYYLDDDGDVSGAIKRGLTRKEYGELFGYDDELVYDLFGEDFEWPVD